MANIDNVQLPDGSSYNIVDNTSGFATQNYVDSAVDSVTKTTIGLGNVDNTSDLDKPVSTAQQTAIDNAVATKVNKTDIAPVESSSTASQAYAIGDQFYYNGLLYKATAEIASGGTITINGNCILADSITEQLRHITIMTLGDTTTSQFATVERIGKVVIVSLSAFTVNISTYPNGVIASNLPRPLYSTYAFAHGLNSGGIILRMIVTNTGELRVTEQSASLITETQNFVTGQLIYYTND